MCIKYVKHINYKVFFVDDVNRYHQKLYFSHNDLGQNCETITYFSNSMEVSLANINKEVKTNI